MKLPREIKNRVGRRCWQIVSTESYVRMRDQLEALVAAGTVQPGDIDRWLPEEFAAKGKS